LTNDYEDFEEVTNVATPSSLLDRADERRMRGSLLVLAGSSTGQMVLLEENITVIGRSEHCNVQLIDNGVSRKHCQFLADDHGRYVVEDLGSRNGTYLNGERITRAELNNGDKVQLGRTTILRFSMQDELDESFQQQLIDSALRDGMTKAYNRKYFLDRLDAELKFAQRHEQPLALLVLDLDHFKNINDTYGHLAGDKALVIFAEEITKQIRNEDVFARYGGEEFAVISRSIDTSQAKVFAERLRTAVEKKVIEYDGNTFQFTVSIGIAGIPENNVRDSVALLDAADRALYQAKRQGRNCVAIFEVLPPYFDPEDDTD